MFEEKYDKVLARELRTALRRVQDVRTRTPAGAADLIDQLHRLTEALARLDAAHHPSLPGVRERLQALLHQREQLRVADLHARTVTS